MTSTIKTRLRQLYASASSLTAANPVLLEGEWGTESDTGKRKVGNGTTAWNELPYWKADLGSVGFVFTQSTPSTTWTINHNLGYRPSVELFDSGSQEIDGEVSHPTVNQTIVSLNPATAGTARLI